MEILVREERGRGAGGGGGGEVEARHVGWQGFSGGGRAKVGEEEEDEEKALQPHDLFARDLALLALRRAPLKRVCQLARRN